ncbi:MAG TPA: hypothetical protein VK137_15215, partial [Planctomycetaceae bacterium]|nr:hypothetical protein [Planctomycetaceae bacterium]
MSDRQTEPTSQPGPKRANVLFQLSVLSAVVFIVTVLAQVATVFGDQSAPATKWLNQNAGKLIAAEVVATLLLGFAAMSQDRRQTLRERDQTDSASKSESRQ